MKRASILICALVFASAGGFAQEQSAAPTPNMALASILTPVFASTTACPHPQGQILFTAAAPEAGAIKYKPMDWCVVCADSLETDCYACCRCAGYSHPECATPCPDQGAALKAPDRPQISLPELRALDSV